MAKERKPRTPKVKRTNKSFFTEKGKFVGIKMDEATFKKILLKAEMSGFGVSSIIRNLCAKHIDKWSP